MLRSAVSSLSHWHSHYLEALPVPGGREGAGMWSLTLSFPAPAHTADCRPALPGSDTWHLF